MSTTQQPRTAPARSTEEAKKARERAATKATPNIAKALVAGRKITVAQLVALVAKDAAETGVEELTDDVIGKMGDAIVENGLLVGYTAARYGKGRWVGKATGRAARKQFGAAKKTT
jgi:hypothetical protein